MAAIFEKRKTFVQKKPVICHFTEVFVNTLQLLLTLQTRYKRLFASKGKQ